MENQNKKDEKKKDFPKTHEECGCKREDFIDSLNYIPREDLQKLLLQGYVEAECENCGTEYRIEKEELEKIVKEITEMNISCDTSLCNTCDIGCFD